MKPDLYTAEEAADRLKLHPKTVRRYLREGRLKGARVGKQYRITRQELDAFAGIAPAHEDFARARRRRIETSSIVQIDAISPDEANRVSNGVIGAAKGRDSEDPPLHVDAVYYPEHGRLKLVISGSAGTISQLLALVSLCTEGAT